MCFAFLRDYVADTQKNTDGSFRVARNGYSFRFLLGTGSKPPLFQGLHRRMRQTVSTEPTRIPHSVTASMQYWEQVGVNRHVGFAFAGEIKRRYKRTGRRKISRKNAIFSPFRSTICGTYFLFCGFLPRVSAGDKGSPASICSLDRQYCRSRFTSCIFTFAAAA